MIISYLPDAAKELQVAALYYHRQAGLGEAFLTETKKAENLLKSSPNAWIKLERSIRRITLRQFPYHLIYTVKQEKIVILAAAHHRRRPDYWRSRIS